MKKQFIFLKHLDSIDVQIVVTEKNIITERLRATRLNNIQNSSSNLVCIVLPDHMVSSFELSINTRNQSQLNKVARYAVEEKFPSRLDDYHIVSNKSSGQRASVRAIKHSRMKDILNLLSQHNITADEVTVESDLLNKNTCTMLFNDNELTLCGDGLEQTYEFDRSVAPLITEEMFTLLKDTKDLHIIHSGNEELILESIENQAPDSIRIKKIIKDERYYESICLNKFSNINLLQSEYKATNKEIESNSFWKYPIYLAAASLLTITGGLYAQNLILSKQINKKELSLIKTYTTLFPEASKPKDVIDLSMKLRNKKNGNATLSKSELPVNTLLLLEKASAASSKLKLEFHGFNIDKNSAELLVVGSSIESLNSFKEKIQAELPNLSINLDSVTSIEKKYQGKLRIK